MCVNNVIDDDDDDDDDGGGGGGVDAFVEFLCSVLGIYSRESFLFIKRMKRWFERADGDHGDKAWNEEEAVEMGGFAVVVLFA